MKTTKLFKVGALALATLTIFVGCGGQKNDKVAQDAVHTAMVNSSKVKSENYDLLLSGKITAGKDSQTQFKEIDGTLNFSGVFDMKTKDSPKFTLKIAAKGTMDGGKEQSIEGEMLLASKNFFFSVSKLNLEAVPELYKTAIDQFMNKWWSVELPPESFARLTTGAVDDKDLTPEQKQIKDLLEKTQFFKNVSDKGADKVGDVAAEKYYVELDKEAFKNYLTEAAKISGQESQQPDAAQIDKFMALVEFKGNVWVSKDDQMLRKIDGTVKIAPGVETDNSTITLQATYTVDNLNKDMKVDAPAKSEKFDISKFLGAAAPVAPAIPAVK